MRLEFLLWRNDEKSDSAFDAERAEIVHRSVKGEAGCNIRRPPNEMCRGRIRRPSYTRLFRLSPEGGRS